MNLFIFSLEHEENARFHCDRHVVKMCIEYAQLLSTACRLKGQDEGYRLTHVNHPCSLWVQKSKANWRWVLDLLAALNAEYRFRYGKEPNHKSFEVAQSLTCPDLPNEGLSPFAQVMPEQYRQADCVQAYRDYFRGEKRRLAQWTKREVPGWFSN
ncbi:MAG: hypothetical protein RRB13_02410 [bacterium]|nr:hypothetical protein [bacterium]